MSRAVLLPYAPSSVTAARQHLCSELRTAAIPESTVENAALVISELLSNALRHASPLPTPFPPDSVRVAWTIAAPVEMDANGCIEIAVSDGGSASMPRLARPSLSALGGRGLGIVQYLAENWGVHHAGGATTVWAVLEFPIRSTRITATGEDTSFSPPGRPLNGWTDAMDPEIFASEVAGDTGQSLSAPFPSNHR